MADTISRIARECGAEKVAVAWHDEATGDAGSYHGDWWFHAASTIKVAVLAATFGAVAAKRFPLDGPVHVRNCFHSVVDGTPYRVDRARDSDKEVHAAVGRTLSVAELAERMIVTSSNLATNVLMDLVGVDHARASFERLGVHGVELVRGVEDERAWEAGINNRVSANGLVQLFRRIASGRAISPEASRRMLAILHRQQFRSGLPAGLPPGARVAHKTGEISTVAHDAGLVYLPRRKPYAIAVLTQWRADVEGRQKAIAALSRAVYDHLVRRRPA